MSQSLRQIMAEGELWGVRFVIEDGQQVSGAGSNPHIIVTKVT